MSESRVRSAVKALSWRLVGTATTMGLVFLVSQERVLALAVGGVELAVRILVFDLYERAWNGVPRGEAA